MIKSKSDLKYYLWCDEMARWGGYGNKEKHGIKWKFNVALRNLEYRENHKRSIVNAIIKKYWACRYKYYSLLTGWIIPTNVFGPGLCIVHEGTVVVSANAKFGYNCRIHACVNIGSSDGTPVGGDDIYIGPGAKLYGDIRLGNGIAVGANAVVNKNFILENITIAGIPAKKISDKGSAGKMPIGSAFLKKNIQKKE